MLTTRDEATTGQSLALTAHTGNQCCHNEQHETGLVEAPGVKYQNDFETNFDLTLK